MHKLSKAIQKVLNLKNLIWAKAIRVNYPIKM